MARVRLVKAMSRSVHDHHLMAFEVDGVGRRIILHTVLAHGLTSDVFTQENLERTFSGVLRHFVLGGTDLHDDEDDRQVTVITDDERPFVVYDDRPEN